MPTEQTGEQRAYDAGIFVYIPTAIDINVVDNDIEDSCIVDTVVGPEQTIVYVNNIMVHSSMVDSAKIRQFYGSHFYCRQPLRQTVLWQMSYNGRFPSAVCLSVFMCVFLIPNSLKRDVSV